MSVTDVENYWSAELGETVEITPIGWNEWPSEYGLYVNGSSVGSFRMLEEVEDYLSRYFVLKGA